MLKGSLKKTKEISILIPFTSNPYYSSAYSILHFFLKTVILGGKNDTKYCQSKNCTRQSETGNDFIGGSFDRQEGM